MGLIKPKLSGTTSESGSSLQHEAAMRVEERFLAEEKKRRHEQTMGRLRTFFFLFLLLGVGGGGFYAWRTGMLDSVLAAFGLGKGAATEEAGGDAETKTSESPAEMQKSKRSVRKIEERIDAFNEMEARFTGATLAYWKDALPEDKPVAKGPPLTYAALVPDMRGGCMFLEVRLSGDNSMKIRKVTRTRAKEVSRAEFNKMIEATPYLVMREGRAYYCSAGKPAPQTGLPVPAKGKAFNPSRQEFGALYDQVAKAKLPRPTFRYDVFLNLTQFKRKLPVATIGFGEEVSRDRFEAAARAAVDDDEAVAAMLSFGEVDFSPAR